jgi:hypothetical protein
MEKKIGAMAILIALGLGFSMVFTMDEIVTRPIEVVTYPYNQCLKVVTKEGEKPCSWLQEGMPHRLEYITNPQHGWVDR